MSRFSWFGIALIVVGAIMLLHRLGVWDIGWMAGVWVLIAVSGLARGVNGFTKRKPHRVFWGTFWFLFGAYCLLRNLDVVELEEYWWMPAMLLILGFSFLMLFASTPKEWHLLVPSLVLLGVGTTMVLTEYGYFYRYDVIHALRVYWPAALILFGLSLILNRVYSHSRCKVRHKKDGPLNAGRPIE